MPSTTRVSGLGVLIMLAACFYLMVFADDLAGRPGAWAAGFLFFGYMGFANWWFARDLFLGRAAARRGDYARAVRLLEAAASRFEDLAWIDRFRMVLLFSPTGCRYRESALLALAHCHALAGHREALGAFERCAEAFPKSSRATASLMLLRLGARIGARGGRIELPEAA